MKKFVRLALGAGLVSGTVFLAVASSHREAPLISADPLADWREQQEAEQAGAPS